MDFLSKLFASYIFVKDIKYLRRAINHGIYRYDGLVAFKFNKSFQETRDWLEYFQNIMNKADVY